jgi:hypothetical protein
MSKNTRKKLLVFISVLSLAMLACIVTGRSGRVVEQREVIPVSGLESAEITLRMGAGKLEVGSGTNDLMEGVFTYNDRSYAPVLDYVESGSGSGDLVVEQEEIRSFNLRKKYTLVWDLAFTGQIPLDMYISLGAGEAELDTSGLNLSAFELDMGAGEATLILPEQIERDLEVSIQGGVGQLNVEIPEGVSVYAEVSGGLGEVEVYGMMQDGRSYYTPDYEEGAPAVYLDVEGGVGEINLEVQ